MLKLLLPSNAFDAKPTIMSDDNVANMDAEASSSTSTGSTMNVASPDNVQQNQEQDFPKVEQHGDVNITQFGTVRVMETGKGTVIYKEGDAAGKQQEGDGYLSADEMDEDLPPALRFIAPVDVVPEVETDPSMTHFEWVGTAGQKVTVITGIEHLTQLVSFSLRSNFVREVSSLSTLTNLTSLELYENRLNSLEGVQNLVNLTNLDLSYNRLRVLEPHIFAPLVKLERLHIAQNKLEKIQGLETLTNLRILDLGMNRIREMEGLDTLVNLEELWLGKNKIEKIKGIDTLKKLVRISVQSNRLRSIGDGLQGLESLEELYLSHQAIVKFEGLENLSKLNTLDVSNNRITSMDGLPIDSLPELEELWMSYNQVATFDEVDKLQPLGDRLRTIYLEHNPVARDFEYRKRLAKTIPSLVQIDAVRFR